MAVAHGYFVESVETLLAQAQPGGKVNLDTEVDFVAARTVGDTVLGFPFEAWGRQGLEEMRLILRFASTMTFPIPGRDAGEHEARRDEAKAACSAWESGACGSLPPMRRAAQGFCG